MQKKHCTASFASPYDGRSELAVALRVLDQVLAAAVEKQAKVLGPASLLDPWRGMHLDRNDVDRLLERTPLSGTWEPGDGLAEFLGHALLQVPRLAALRTDDFDVVDFAILLILLAPDIDLRYEKIYGYLQDDISRRRPTTDLIANLLARDMQERLAVCARLQANSALARFAMLALIGNSDTPPLARAWRIDDVWRNWMLGAKRSARTVERPRATADARRVRARRRDRGVFCTRTVAAHRRCERAAFDSAAAIAVGSAGLRKIRFGKSTGERNTGAHPDRRPA